MKYPHICVFSAILSIYSVPCFAESTPSATELLESLRLRLSPKIVAAENSFPKPLNNTVTKEMNRMLQEEELASVIESTLVKPWQESWHSKNWDDFHQLTSSTFHVTSWKMDAASPKAPPYFELHTWSQAETTSKKFIEDYFSQYASLDDVSLDYTATSPLDGQNFSGELEKIQKANLDIHFDVRGTTTSGSIRNDRGLFKAEIIKDGKKWKLENLTLVSGETVSSTKKFFSDATEKTALNTAPVYVRGEAIRRGGYAISLADYNNDGHLDLYLGTEGESILYKGKKDGSFERDSLAKFDDRSVKTAIFADFDNDGWQDLVTIKFVPNEEQMVTLYKNKKGTFVKQTKNFAKNQPDYAMPATVGDFNGDGLLDLYVGYPGFRDFTHMEPSPKKHAEKSAHGLYINDGKGSFLQSKHTPFLEQKHRTKNQGLVFPHAAIAVDYNNDGIQDLIVMDDRGGLSPVFQNLGKGKFREVGNQIGLSNYGYGMGTAVADYDHDGRPDIVMTNVDFTSSMRMAYADIRNPSGRKPEMKNLARGLVVYRNVGKNKFIPVKGIGLDWAGLGAGGAEFIDFDNDGWADLYVTNGLWSGTLKNEDLSSYFSRAMHVGITWDRPSLDFGRSSFMNILSDYKHGLSSTSIDGHLSMAGYQRNRLFRNNRDGTFTEIGYLAGVDSLSDGYIAAKADLNKDGKMDLVLRNADPGTKEYTFPSVQAFINETPVNDKSVIVRLVGKGSNRDAVGAKVTATIAKKRFTQELLANNGSAQGEKLIHIGLGNARLLDKLEVLWPSGSRSVLFKVGPGEVQIKEQGTQRLGAIQK